MILQQSFNANYNILEFLGKFRIFSFLRGLRIRFPFGFFTRMLFLLWCVCGGFLLHFYESLILDIILKKYYEDPIDTAQDVIDRGLTVIHPPGQESRVEILKNDPSNITICFLYDEQKMDTGGEVQQSHVEVPAGHSQFYIYSQGPAILHSMFRPSFLHKIFIKS